MKYLIGLKFERLTVIKKVKPIIKNWSTFLCKCDCGKKIKALGYLLKAGRKKSCGCLWQDKFKFKKTLPDLIAGGKFNNLTVISFVNKKSDGTFNYKCKCDCGKEVIVSSKSLLSNNNKSCGCLKFLTKEEAIKNNAKKIYTKIYDDGDISFEEFLILSQNPCYYCGTLLSNSFNMYKHKSGNKKNTSTQFVKDNGAFNYNGLDRVNNNIGHFKNNVVSCCKTCNFMKRNKSKNDFLNHVKLIYNYHLKFKK